jgi:hypothetical protein
VDPVEATVDLVEDSVDPAEATECPVEVTVGPTAATAPEKFTEDRVQN